MEPVTLTVVGDEMDAEVVCGLLRSSGIKCNHVPADAGGGLEAVGSGGPREVLVAPEDLEEARVILAANDPASEADPA